MQYLYRHGYLTFRLLNYMGMLPLSLGLMCTGLPSNGSIVRDCYLDFLPNMYIFFPESQRLSGKQPLKYNICKSPSTSTGIF